MDHVNESGFRQISDLVHLFIGGSELHGAKVGATDDLDIYGVYVEEPAAALGLTSRDHFVWSTAGTERRNGPEDVDITLYSLRRWAELAVKGNATALHFLFADATAVSTPVWKWLQEHRRHFVSKRSVEQFIGFADNQKRRITGEKGRGTKGQRPEYIGRFGYDTKAAMHCLRLYLECIELMESGTITLPRPEREYLIEVRSGGWSTERFLDEAGRMHARTILAAEESRLPAAVDTGHVSRIVAETHFRHWSYSL